MKTTESKLESLVDEMSSVMDALRFHAETYTSDNSSDEAKEVAKQAIKELLINNPHVFNFLVSQPETKEFLSEETLQLIQLTSDIYLRRKLKEA